MSAANDQRRHVLFLDDDAKLLETIGQLFAVWSKNTWQVHLATTTAKALKVLDENRVDLVVLDLQMPVVDGMQFLLLLNRKHPNVPKVVMTGYATEDNRTAAFKHSVELFLEKPRTTEGFESVFATLNELASNPVQQEGFRGVLRKVGLPEVIQLECLGRKSSVLEVSTKSARGHIYIETGSIIHAELGETKGEAAFNSMLSFDGGEFNLRPFSEPTERTIQGQWEFLLMEAARVQDEIAERNKTSSDRAGISPGSEGVAPLLPDSAKNDASGSVDPTESIVQPAPAVARPVLPDLRSIEEFIVCSAQGDVLYEWQCPGIEMRVKLLDFIARRAMQFSLAFPLGNFDRLEIIGSKGRVVTQIHPDRKLFVRSAPLQP